MELNTVSYRAECQGDVTTLNHTLLTKGLCHRITRYEPDLKLGEVLVEMQVWNNCTIEDVKSVLRNQIDSHVLLETLRPVPMSDNTMERDRTMV